MIERAICAALCACAAAFLGGCTEAAAPSPYRAATDVKQLMNWILDPSADVIWGAAGTVTTLEGETDLTPTTDEGWDAVRNAAAVVAESGNLLMLPGHVQEGADWNEFAAGITRTGLALVAAAEARDGQAIFDLGGQLYNVCVACHQLYILPDAE